MEELNKNQIVLLTLLVSFVTSIATGIVTVTLMDQVPAGVTQTINRVVERTVEKVVPQETQVATVVREVPVIVTEEELIVQVVNEAAPAVVRFLGEAPVPAPDAPSGAEATTTPDTASLPPKEVALGSGFFADNYLVTAAKIFPPLSAAATDSTLPVYKAALDDGRIIFLNRLTLPETENTLAVFTVLGEDINNLPSLALASSSSLIGQTAVALGASWETGADPDRLPQAGLNVSVGILSSFVPRGSATGDFIVTQAVNVDNVGGPLLNTKGEVIGLNYGAGLALPSEVISLTLDSLR